MESPERLSIQVTSQHSGFAALKQFLEEHPDLDFGDVIEQPVSAATTFPDLATLKRASSTATPQERQLVMLTNAMPALIAFLDRELRYRFINRAYAEFFRRPINELLGRHVREVVGSTAYQQIESKLQNALAGNRQQFELLLGPPDFEEYSAKEISYVPKLEASGNVSGIYLLGVDVTVQKLAQREALRLRGQAEASQERLTLLVTMAEQSGDFIGVTDLTGRGIFFNAAGRALVGLEAHQPAESVTLSDFFFPEDLKIAEDLIEHTIAAGHRTQELRFHHWRTGQSIEVQCDLFRIDNPDTGAPMALGTITRDIRKQKADERRLIEARHKADAANRSKSEFLANMSHEIRTPMTAIIGFADLLQGQLTRDDDRQLLQTIQDNGRHLLQIINDILDLSKIDAGKLQITPVETSITELVRELCGLMRIRADEKSLDLVSEIDSAVPEKFVTDPLRLKQVLINLIGNAIKFTDEGRVTLRVDTEGNDLRLHVIDTGSGISEAQQQALFQPFTQLDSSDTRQAGGTGLGLAISRRLARRLNGRLQLESRVGEGSRFTVCLPLRSEQDAPAGKGAAAPRPESAASPDDVAGDVAGDQPLLEAAKVLVVDDRPEVRFLADRLLASVSVTVTTVDRAEAAYQELQAATRGGTPFDLLLTDIEMPGMDGFELVRRLRDKGFRQPIIALTAHALPEDLQRCLDAGCNAYLSKPLDRDALLRTVGECLKKTHRPTSEPDGSRRDQAL